MQVCSFDGFFCPFVCLSVCFVSATCQSFDQSLLNLVHICSLVLETLPIHFVIQRSNNHVRGSKSKSNFEIAITPSIFELECWSKAQNVGNVLGYLVDIINFRWHLQRKGSLVTQNFVSFENLRNIQHCFNWTSYIERLYANHPRKVYFINSIIMKPLSRVQIAF